MLYITFSSINYITSTYICSASFFSELDFMLPLKGSLMTKSRTQTPFRIPDRNERNKGLYFATISRQGSSGEQIDKYTNKKIVEPIAGDNRIGPFIYALKDDHRYRRSPRAAVYRT